MYRFNPLWLICLLACSDKDERVVVPLELPDMLVSAPNEAGAADQADGMIQDDPRNDELDASLPIIDLTSEASGNCESVTPFEGNRNIFEEVTDAWELSAIGAQGSRLSVGDIDGDGWPDLAVRRAGQRFDRFSDNETLRRQHHWLLKNEGGRFIDVTLSSGFSEVRGTYSEAVGRPAEVVAFGDVDNDGDLDVYTGVDTRTILELRDDSDTVVDTIEERSELLLNQGDGTFVLGPEDHILRRLNRQDVPSGASFTDVDRDGFIDLWVTQGGLGAPMQDRLYLSNGDGSFRDATRDLGLRTENWIDPAVMNEGRAHSTAWSGAACDLNQDGDPDLLAGSYGRAPNLLWRAASDENGLTFINESAASGYAYDQNQTWQDNEFAACYCRTNPDSDGCGEANPPRISCGQTNWRHNTDREAFRLGGNTGATICADFDNDGWQDLVTTEIKHWWAGSGSDGAELLLNRRDDTIRLSRPGNEMTGLARTHPPANWDEGFMTGSWLDFDNDGRKDIYLGGSDYAGNRGRLYHNQSSVGMPRFVELSTDIFFEHNRSHGIAVADFDRDGYQDIIVGHSRSRCDASAANNCYETAQIRGFRNTLNDTGHWIQLKLEGNSNTNRSAIGAQVKVTTSMGTQLYEVGGGYGHFGAQDDLIIHVGLGENCQADVTIRWPDRELSRTRYLLPADMRFKIRQGERPEATFTNTAN